MQFKITETETFTLVGKKINTSMAKNETRELWQSFKSRLREVTNRVNDSFYSVQVYPPDKDISSFTPHTEFEKWAAVEVSDISSIPEGMDQLVIPSGLYAIFVHKGPVSTFSMTTNYIFKEWLPESGFVFDKRPQFEIMDHRYLGPMDENSEEEVWVPIKEIN